MFTPMMIYAYGLARRKCHSNEISPKDSMIR
jgi:hypothetical protein